MFDHTFRDVDGSETPVSQMSDEALLDCLARGVTVYAQPRGSDIVERLRIERTIRLMGLRA